MECSSCHKTCSLPEDEHYAECPNCHIVLCPECMEERAKHLDIKEKNKIQHLREGDAGVRMQILCPNCNYQWFFANN